MLYILVLRYSIKQIPTKLCPELRLSPMGLITPLWAVDRITRHVDV